jgi:hypothetical protein
MSTSLHLSCIVTNVIHLPLCIASRRRNQRLAFYLIQILQRRIGIFAQSIELFRNYAMCAICTSEISNKLICILNYKIMKKDRYSQGRLNRGSVG